MTTFGFVHRFGFGYTPSARMAVGMVQQRSDIELQSFCTPDEAYRFGAYAYAARYAGRGRQATLAFLLPPMEAMRDNCLFDEPGMPPYHICTDRWYALLTGQGETGITSSYEDLFWFLSDLGRNNPVWIKECNSVETAQDWIYQKILPPVMVKSAYVPYAGMIHMPQPGCLMPAIQPGYLSAGEPVWRSSKQLSISNPARGQ